VRTQPLCTLRDLDELGVAPEAIAVRPVAVRQRVIKAVSGKLATWLRPRYTFPLVPTLAELDASGLTLGATATLSGAATQVADVVVSVVAGGVAGPSVTVRVSMDAGVTWGPTTALDASGAIAIDGARLAFTGSLAPGDVCTYLADIDGGVRLAVAQYAVWTLLHNRGLDPATEQDVKQLHDDAIEWVRDVRHEEAELEPTIDATPGYPEGGGIGDGQQNPWDWQDDAATRDRGLVPGGL
jgi:hypothetical protein